MEYIFTIQINGGAEVEVKPHWGNDLSIEESLESSQRFFRTSLSGSLKFLGKDYDLIRTMPFDSVATLYIYGGKEDYRFKFLKPDCVFDEDNKIVEVKVTPYDSYSTILKNYDKEQDLVRLGLRPETIHYFERPVIQMYYPGATEISCFLGYNNWEQEVNPVTSIKELENKHFFTLDARILVIEINNEVQNSGVVVPDELVGIYAGSVKYEALGDNNLIVNTLIDKLNDENVKIRYIAATIRDVGEDFGREWRETYELIVNGEVKYEHTGSFYDYKPNASPRRFMLYGEGQGILADETTYPIYSRIVLDVPTYDGMQMHEINADDLVGETKNYRYVNPIRTRSVSASLRYSDTDTYFGSAQDLGYFMPPSDRGFFPLFKSEWNKVSFWGEESLLNTFEARGRKKVALNDAYSLHNVISGLLAKVSPEISFKPTPEYSEFLYSDKSPVGNEKLDLYITQKSNILYGEYSLPAQKAPIKLSELLEDLCAMFQLYWFVEDNKLRLEHISWFNNGGSYNIEQFVGIDLSTIINPRNGQSWDYAVSKFEYEKSDIPKQYEFAWMDDVSRAFIGVPMEVTSGSAEDGYIESVSVSTMTTDIDYGIANASSMSPDGFMMFSVVKGYFFTEPDNVSDPEGGAYCPGGGTNSDKTYSVPKSNYDTKIRLRVRAFGEEGGGAGVVATDYGFLTDLIDNVIFPDGVEREIEFTLPSNISEITFASLNEHPIRVYVLDISSEAYKEVTIGNVRVNREYFLCQNHLLAMPNLQLNYWRSNLPSEMVKINGDYVSANGLMRNRVQDVKIPATGLELDKNKLVRTSVGDGQIEKISLNLSTLIADVKLKHVID